MMSTFLGRSIVAAVVVTALASPAVAQEAETKPVRFTAFAVNLGSGPNAGTVDIVST